MRSFHLGLTSLYFLLEKNLGYSPSQVEELHIGHAIQTLGKVAETTRWLKSGSANQGAKDLSDSILRSLELTRKVLELLADDVVAIEFVAAKTLEFKLRGALNARDTQKLSLLVGKLEKGLDPFRDRQFETVETLDAPESSE